MYNRCQLGGKTAILDDATEHRYKNPAALRNTPSGITSNMVHIRTVWRQALYLFGGANRLTGYDDEPDARAFHLLLIAFLFWVGIMAFLVVPLFVVRKVATLGLLLVVGGAALAALGLLRRGFKRAAAAEFLCVTWGWVPPQRRRQQLRGLGYRRHPRSRLAAQPLRGARLRRRHAPGLFHRGLPAAHQAPTTPLLPRRAAGPLGRRGRNRVAGCRPPPRLS
jgi:hypothetical protein